MNKRLLVLAIVSVFLLASQVLAAEPLTNDHVIKMVQSGVPVEIILKTIRAAETFQFSMLPGDLIALGQAKVPEEIIKAMAARINRGPVLPTAPDQPAPATIPTAPNAAVAPAATVTRLRAPERQKTDSDGPYGFRTGSVALGGSGGFTYISGLTGVHPNAGGEVSVGLFRYVGLFGQGGYSPLAHVSGCDPYGFYCVDASVHIFYVSGGAEIVGTNRSRFVPFGRVGVGYGRGIASISINGYGGNGSLGAPAAVFGGGLRTYVTRHFGISGGIEAYRTVGNFGGNTFLMPTAGVFFQTR